jgi:hypothetical protein
VSSSRRPSDLASSDADARRTDEIMISEVIRISLADSGNDRKHPSTSSSATLRT